MSSSHSLDGSTHGEPSRQQGSPDTSVSSHTPPCPPPHFGRDANSPSALGHLEQQGQQDPLLPRLHLSARSTLRLVPLRQEPA